MAALLLFLFYRSILKKYKFIFFDSVNRRAGQAV